MIDIKVPAVGESITEVSLVKWVKKSGDWVERDEVLAELESEKATFEVNAEKAGILQTNAAEGDTLNIVIYSLKLMMQLKKSCQFPVPHYR
jgi:2-oxoglutarate dehydrogenase E2 component (dihydrolipoamide succinyltransferase)